MLKLINIKPESLFLLFLLYVYVKTLDGERPFRTLKVNQIWEKAQKLHSGPKLADLYADLKIQDKVEIELKKLKAEDMDKDGMKEAEVRQRLMDLLEKYNMKNVVSMPKPQDISNEIPETFDHQLRDKKLQKLWKKAEFAGFSESELEKLKEEFLHHQMKVDEYNSLQENFNLRDDYEDNLIDVEQNRVKKNKKLELKTMYKDLKTEYDKLESMAAGVNVPDKSFQDPRVYELWALAQRARMSPTELESIKTELQHFEHRLQKHEYYQDQLRISDEALKLNYKDGEVPDKHAKLEQMARDYGRKVEKYHTDLKYRINKALKQHIEL
ncbi:alpha-2-macroglobulin receptor-associated protein-like [Saccostrea echinata]|uniref:alpha-2-macroglobulin receptor-associated protein-like n=1 Tax=Saccostrea echinata TaxID=191078 RepID=UPI002A810107|nr:alpha-2-macroglobulin receptor-associated protein-like [Saccostrea echinata]XP_061196089.1 alpha-2-macroglobulin receptor-associated protein-like [Saccostrea echinata]